MAKVFRLLSRRKKNKQDNVDSLSMRKRAKDSDIECKIIHLDGTDFTFYLDKNATGQVLEEYTFQQIEVADDKNYFGLQYTDRKNINHWLDISKKVRKQCEIGPPYTLRFQVKFYSSDPCNQLRDEYTRYLFVLQLKQMIKDGNLLCTDIDLAAEIAALSLQGELGDFDPEVHNPYFVSQYRFLPEKQQTEEFELLVTEKYRLLKDRYIVPSTADRQYLEKCRTLADYGIDRHHIKGKNDKDYVLGLTPSGILIYEGNTKIGLFPWNQVTKLSFKKTRFKIVVRDVKEDDQGEMEHTFIFESVACKQMWKSCVEHHAFFRLEGAHKPPTRLQQFFRLKSRFYASFHTEYQMAVKSTFGCSTRRSSSFNRATSVRGRPRQSFERNEVERRKIQQKYRDKFREESKNSALLKLSESESEDVNIKVATRSLPTQAKIDISANIMNYQKQPRVLNQNSIISTSSSLQHQSSTDSTISDNSGNDNEKVKIMSKAVPSRPTALPKTTNTTKMTPNSVNQSKTSTNNHKPGYAPIPPQRNVKPPQKQSKNTQDNPNQVILV